MGPQNLNAQFLIKNNLQNITKIIISKNTLIKNKKILNMLLIKKKKRGHMKERGHIWGSYYDTD